MSDFSDRQVTITKGPGGGPHALLVPIPCASGKALSVVFSCPSQSLNTYVLLNTLGRSGISPRIEVQTRTSYRIEAIFSCEHCAYTLMAVGVREQTTVMKKWL